MNTSTNDDRVHTGGAFADGLTLIRLLLTPIVMFIVIQGWPGTDAAVLASILFTIAALTDIFDDMTGGAETSKNRGLGWFDDIADTVLITGTLAAMFWVLFSSGHVGWIFAVPASVIILRELIIALMKGPSLIRNGWPETRLGNIRTFVTMLAVCLLLASPWITSWLNSAAAEDAAMLGSLGTEAASVWYILIGQGLLWLAALLSLITGFKILTTKNGPANDV